MALSNAELIDAIEQKPLIEIVELGLLFDGGRFGRAGHRAGRHRRHRGGRYAPLLFHRLDEIDDLDQGFLLKGFDELRIGKCHCHPLPIRFRFRPIRPR